MALVVHRSHRLELLAELLADVVRTPLSDPFARECIVVQGPGMERWLSASLSRALGVWGNPWFPFPRALIELFLEATDDAAASEAARFDSESMVWRIARLLPGLLSEPSMRDVARYLEGDGQHERLLDLSRRLAETFDQYIIYRPELVLGWERGADSHFQAVLFRALLADRPRPPHLVERMRTFERALAQGLSLSSLREQRELPERIALFGISTLPPAFLRLLAALGRQLDVHVFLLTPSREYWGDLDRTVALQRDLHGFLGQLGKIGREFIDLLTEHAEFDDDEDALFAPPGYDSMLHALQSDLVDLTARTRHGVGAEQPLVVAKHDDSIQVHVCHSMVRELEVLRDQLRARFERDPTLEPRDVIVFTPDIERYAPAIEAVFAEGNARDDKTIPFRIADRRAVHASETAEAFFALLELAGSRLLLSDVLDFLSRGAVRARFGIAEPELDVVRQWLVDAGARWALDDAHRAGFGQPAFLENSLRFALDRLLVGYAAADGETRELYGALPWSDVEGQGALLLGKLARFLETLFGWVRELATPRPPAEFTARLSSLLEGMLSDEGEWANEQHALRAALSDLGSDAESARFEQPITLRSLRKLLEPRLERGRANLGFLASGLTFCEPVPMRAIPFRVVCLLGMDDESFPRSIARPTFDLMAAEPRPGDRSLRDDDRQLFLEAVLSARDALHISYVGRSAQDGSERPASVLVDQLLRLCDQHFVRGGDGATLSLELEGAVSESIRHEHALHRFDARYFQRAASGAFVSFDSTAEQAARSLTAAKRALAPFVSAPLTGRALPTTSSIAAFRRFFRYPQEVYLKQRLSLFLPRELTPVDDREPIELDNLESYRLRDELLARHDTHVAEQRMRLLQKAGKVAPGAIGTAQLVELEQSVQELLDAAPRSDQLPDREVTLELGALTLTGRLDALEPGERIERSVGSLHARRRFNGWVSHLILCASSASEPRRTRMVGRKERKIESYVFQPLSQERAHALLLELARLHRIGMSMPLPLFHEAAELYVKALAKGEDSERALASARSKLVRQSQGQVTGTSVLDDAHVLQVWSEDQLRRVEELSASDGEETVDFAEVAVRTFGPMLEAQEKG